jgi:hypothetical protein
MLNQRERFEFAERKDRETLDVMRIARAVAALFIVVGVASIAIVARPDVMLQGSASPEEFVPAIGSISPEPSSAVRGEPLRSRKDAMPRGEVDSLPAEASPQYMPHG